MLGFCQWLESTSGSIALHESIWGYPIIESVHVLTLCLFLGLAVMLAGPFLPGVQWGLIALLWWAAMFLPGLSMHREKRRRAHDTTATRLL